MKNIAEYFRPSLRKLPASLCWLVTAALLTTPVSVFAAGGDLDPVFGANPGPGFVVDGHNRVNVHVSVIQPDGKILVGSIVSVGTSSFPVIARLNHAYRTGDS